MNNTLISTKSFYIKLFTIVYMLFNFEVLSVFFSFNLNIQRYDFVNSLSLIH